MNRRDFLRFAGLAANAALLKSCAPSDTPKQQGERDMKTDGSERMTPMIAACGMNCDECPIRKAANDKAFAEELAAQWRKSGRTQAAADWFTCQGCHGREDLVWSGDCGIRSCCIKKKGLANCSLCGEFPCSLIDEFEKDGYEHHTKAVQYLKELRRLRGAS